METKKQQSEQEKKQSNDQKILLKDIMALDVTPEEKSDLFKTWLNREPPQNWLVPSEVVKGGLVLPIKRVVRLLNNLYAEWWTSDYQVTTTQNAVILVIKLTVKEPFENGKETSVAGIGGSAIQISKNASFYNVSAATSAAESMAIKNAARKLGRIFGRFSDAEYNDEYSTSLQEKFNNLAEKAQATIK